LVCPPKSLDRFADFRRVGKQDPKGHCKDSGSAEAYIDPSFALAGPISPIERKRAIVAVTTLRRMRIFQLLLT
jgi:hypothetical protein